MKTTTKTGRKRKDFPHPETGKPVVGLTRRPDGRWRIIGTYQTFRESDEQKAIEKFRRMMTRPMLDAPRSTPFTKVERLAADWEELTEDEIKAVPFYILSRFFLE